MESTPLVSIACITYNHVKFIAQAIEGFLMQKTSFSFEIVIHDDCSTDGTRKIIEAYAKEYPALIKPVYQSTNQYSTGKRIIPIIVPLCRGKYVALCEGDDFWIDPLKLQKQVDFLEEKPNASLCFHAVNIVDVNGKITSKSNVFELKQEYTTIDVLTQEWFVMTCSIMFRKQYLTIPDWFVNFRNGDYALQLLCSLKGNFIYLDSIMGAYRVHSMGMSQNLQHENNYYSLSLLLDHFNKFSDFKFNGIIKNKKNQMRNSLVHYYLYETKKNKYLSLEYFKSLKKFISLIKFFKIYHLKLTVNLLIPPKIYKF